MRITLNGEPRELSGAPRVADLLAEHLGHLPERGVAVAVNEEVLDRGEWSERTLAPEDRVEIVGFVGGG